MRKIILFIMLIVIVSANAQSYVPFPTENASWSQIYFKQGVCDFPCKYQFKMMGDTILNSVDYHKIYRQNDSLATSVNAFYFGALRESGKKIYFQFPNCNHEIRLYDFTKNVGDTINSLLSESESCGSSLTGNGTVTGIESIQINGSYRRAFHIHAYGVDYTWIEGIGSTSGLFNPVTPQTTCTCNWWLICSHHDNVLEFMNTLDQIKYVDPNISCFPSVLDGLINPINRKPVTISPNPVTGSSVIHWEISENNQYLTFVITDVLGKNVKTLNVSGKSEVSIQRNDFKEGIYFGRLAGATHQNQAIKIIIQ